MKITEVRACQPLADSPPDWRTSMGQILVVVETDDGLVGWGVGGGGLAGIHIIRTVLRDLLIGEDPEQISELSRKMHDATLPFGRMGVAIMALSGVDLALWDLRGKRSGKLIVELLGGEAGKTLPTYVTVGLADDGLEDAISAGHRAFKLFVGGDTSANRVVNTIKRVKEARRTVGPETPLMIDAWMKWDVETTLAVAEKLGEFNVGWLEDPLAPDDWAGYEILKGKSPLPISGGEHDFTVKVFADLIERGIYQVLQPDVCWCGGLTALIEIYQLAARAGVRVCPHRGSEIWSLHAIAALDTEPLAESGRPWMTWVRGQPPISDGRIQLPATGAGFGLEIDESLLRDVWSASNNG